MISSCSVQLNPQQKAHFNMAVKLSVRESKIERELRERVLAAGGRCEKVTVIGSRGFFDRLLLFPGGRIIFVELKRPRGGRTTQHQRQYAYDYTVLGAVVVLIKNSADIDALLENVTAGRGRNALPAVSTHP
jgi:hypothetical protein